MKGCFCMQMKRWHTLVHTATVLLSFINPLWRNYQAFKKTSFTYGVVQPHRTSNTTDRRTRYNADLLNNKKLSFNSVWPNTSKDRLFLWDSQRQKMYSEAYLISNNFNSRKINSVSPPSKSLTCKIWFEIKLKQNWECVENTLECVHIRVRQKWIKEEWIWTGLVSNDFELESELEWKEVECTEFEEIQSS